MKYQHPRIRRTIIHYWERAVHRGNSFGEVEPNGEIRELPATAQNAQGSAPSHRVLNNPSNKIMNRTRSISTQKPAAQRGAPYPTITKNCTSFDVRSSINDSFTQTVRMWDTGYRIPSTGCTDGRHMHTTQLSELLECYK